MNGTFHSTDNMEENGKILKLMLTLNLMQN